MNLISEKKVEEFQEKNKQFLYNLDTCVSAKFALDFAENELKDLSIEFAEWCSNNNYVKSNGDCWIDEHCDIVFENSLLMFEYFVKNVFYSGTSGR